jgi:hypothetical protein
MASVRGDSYPLLRPTGPEVAFYWLLVRGGEFTPEVLTTTPGGGQRALVVFGFRQEAEMYLRLEPEVGERGWRLRQSDAGEVLSMLWGLCKDVGCVALDPLPRGLSRRLPGYPETVMGRQEFMHFLMGGKWSKEEGQKVII